MVDGAAVGVALVGASTAVLMLTVLVPTTTAAIGPFALEHHTAHVGVVSGSAVEHYQRIINDAGRKSDVMKRPPTKAASKVIAWRTGPRKIRSFPRDR